MVNVYKIVKKTRVQGVIFSCLFGPTNDAKPQNIEFTNKENQQILTLENLEPESIFILAI